MILICIVFLMIAMAFLVGKVIISNFNDGIQQNSQLATQTKEITAEANTRYVSVFEGIFISTLIFLWVAVLVSVFLLDTNPAFLIFSVIVLLFVIFIGAVLSNFFEQFRSAPLVSSVAGEFKVIPAVMNAWPLFITVIGFSVVIALYLKGRA